MSNHQNFPEMNHINRGQAYLYQRCWSVNWCITRWKVVERSYTYEKVGCPLLCFFLSFPILIFCLRHSAFKYVKISICRTKPRSKYGKIQAVERLTYINLFCIYPYSHKPYNKYVLMWANNNLEQRKHKLEKVISESK